MSFTQTFLPETHWNKLGNRSAKVQVYVQMWDSGCYGCSYAPSREQVCWKHPQKTLECWVARSCHCQVRQVHERDGKEDGCEDLHVLHCSVIHSFETSCSKFNSAVCFVVHKICATFATGAVAHFACKTRSCVYLRCVDFLSCTLCQTLMFGDLDPPGCWSFAPRNPSAWRLVDIVKLVQNCL